ncbi:UNVERIFIED_CONTAM: putative DNA-binding transcriptional regulator YafY [Acetivibrio alkalicellulosi]
MQINRLIEMVYILLSKKTVTAKELSDHFEVSQRTIYRDIETLSAAGIPIYTIKGKGGGISLLDNFVLNKSMLSEKEQVDILSSLQGLKALNVPDVEPVLKKMAVVFGKNNTSWIDVDFSRWSGNSDEKERFNLFKRSILNKNKVTFNYHSAYGEKTIRTVEPLKLIFKGYAWYVYAFCCNKNDYRFFKVSRINNLIALDSTFTRDIPDNIPVAFKETSDSIINIVLKIKSTMAFRIFDEFGYNCVEENPDGSFTVTAVLPDEEWVYGYILSFGDYAEVLEPSHIRKEIKSKLEACLKKYS